MKNSVIYACHSSWNNFVWANFYGICKKVAWFCQINLRDLQKCLTICNSFHYYLHRCHCFSLWLTFLPKVFRFLSSRSHKLCSVTEVSTAVCCVGGSLFWISSRCAMFYFTMQWVTLIFEFSSLSLFICTSTNMYLYLIYVRYFIKSHRGRKVLFKFMFIWKYKCNFRKYFTPVYFIRYT